MATTITTRNFYHADSSTWTFVVYDTASKDAVLIDSVMDLDTVNWQISHTYNEEVAAFLDAEGLRLHWVLDTHVHADHLTGAQFFKRKYGAPYGIGANITVVQRTFAGLFGLDAAACKTDGSQFDRLLQDGDVLTAGSVTVRCMATHGHTPNCMSYLIADMIFTGDAIFTEDFGTGRCDFPGGSAGDLFDSIQKIFALPPTTRVMVGHDYMPGGRDKRFESTVALEREKNEDITVRTTRAEFIEGKTTWDKQLKFPRLIFPSLLVNMNAGLLPPRHANGHRCFVIPMNLKGDTDDIGMPIAPKL